MKRYLIFILFIGFVLLITNAQSHMQNYIRTFTPRVTVADATTISPEYVPAVTNYFDGLGRPIQTIYEGITPQSTDLVTMIEYDSIGRVSKEWLPVPISDGLTAAYRDPSYVKSQSVSFYDGDAYAYTQIAYDSSPLKRILRKTGPGASWHVNDKSVRLDYLTNTTTGILSVPYYTVEGGKLKKSGNYPIGTLYVNVTKDEDGITVYEFTDTEGKRIRYKNVDYVYDNLGHLRYVLPPRLQLKADGFYEVTPGSDLYNLAFVYTYDKRGNCLTKKLPGIAPIYYVYDRADRLILVQTPNQRPHAEWSFTKYDIYSRPVLSGTVILQNKNHSQLQDEYCNILVREYFVGVSQANCWGYSNETLPTTNLTVLKADYYDDYGFKALTSFGSILDYQVRSGFLSTHYPILTGAHTGSAVKTFDNSITTLLYTAYYYDIKGHLIQQRGNNLIGGYDHFYTSYDFSGEPLEILHEHSSSQISLLTERYSYEYDHRGRLINATHSLNDRSTVYIGHYSYDNLGRLISSGLFYNLSDINYSYNIRSWQTGISSIYYRESVHYGKWLGRILDEPYNGNASGVSYSTSYIDPVSHALKESETIHQHYSYGEQDELVGATSVTFDGSGFSATNQLKEEGGSSPYLRLLRYYKNNSEDYAYLESSSNRLESIHEDGDDDVSSLPIQFVTKYPDGTPTFFYDANGNLSKELNRGITEIDYNILNLPNRITFENGSDIRFTYDADGVKHRADYKTVSNQILVPIGAPSLTGSGSLLVQHHTDYCGNFIYEDGVLKKIRIDGGYINYNASTGGGEYCYYIKDRMGNNRVVLSAARGVIQYADYYPYGIPFSEIPMEEDNFLHAGKELEKMHGLYWYDNGKRWYDPILCRFTTMDPLCEQFYDKNPYSYCAENPMKYGDPTGELASPYYDIDGNFLGVDENGFSGNIYITDSKTVDKYSKDNIINSKAIQADKNTTFVRSVSLTVAAESHIYTDVLKKSSDPNLDMSRLYNGEISVLEKPVTRGNDTYGKGYNDPYPDRRQAKYTEIDVGEEIKVTVSVRSYVTDLYTVESIWNQLGIHEYYGHGIKGWKGDKDHWRCYQAQMKHPSYRKLPQDQKKEIYGRYNEFYKKSQGY